MAFAYPSVKAVVNYLASEVLQLDLLIASAPSTMPVVLVPSKTQELNDEQLERWVDELTSAEVDALLDEKLDQLEQWLEK